MDLIYTDSNLLDLGILKDYVLDFEIGTENDFQIMRKRNKNEFFCGKYSDIFL